MNETEKQDRGRLLQTAAEIMKEYSLTRVTFQTFLRAGMPVTVVNRRYYAHTKNLDKFFEAITNARINPAKAWR
jgi:hypothetical protein